MKFYPYLLIIFSVVFYNCEDAKETGSLTGYAHLNNESTHEGIRVEINQINKYTITDIAGKWVFKDLPQGVYNFTFTKDGFGTYEYFGFDFMGVGDDYFSRFDNHSVEPVIMYKIPDYYITSMNYTISANQININGTLSKYVDEYFRVILFIGYSSDVSYEPGKNIYYDCSYDLDPGDTYSTSIGIQSDLYFSAGITSGTDIYIRAYAGVCYGSYFDPDIGYQVHPVLNPNSVDAIKITVP